MKTQRLLLAIAALAALTLCASSCRHSGGRGVHHGNHLLINGDGTLHGGHLKHPIKCDRKFGEGKIQLSFDNGKKRVKGSARAG